MIVEHDRNCSRSIQQYCLRSGMVIHMQSDMIGAIGELARENHCLLVILCVHCAIDILQLKIIRGLTQAPVLVMSEKYDGEEKIAVIEAGADEYIQWPENIREGLASGHALIRRYTKFNQSISQSLDILSSGILFMNVNYRTAFIGTKELILPRREFDLLYFLASNPGRVFTNEQLYNEVWGEDYLRDADSGLHSCLNRIRRKLEEIPEASCHIENLRGVGYRFVQEDIQ